MLRGIKDYVRAESVEHAARLLAERADSIEILCGGTDLLLVDHGYDTLLDISQLELDYIREEDGALRIGATTSIESISRSALVQSFADGILNTSCRIFGTLQIRNMATIGGNVANAMPAADPPSALMALDAVVVAVSAAGGKIHERQIPIAEFFTGPRKTVLAAREMIREIRIPRAFREWRGAWKKIGRVWRDIALVNVGVSARFAAAGGTTSGGGVSSASGDGRAARAGGPPVIEDVRIALCAVAPAPFRAREAEDLLRGKAATRALLEEAAAAVRRAVRPISDVRASETYRRHVSGVLARRALAEISGLPEE